MLALKQPAPPSIIDSSKVNSTTLEHFLRGLRFPASKQDILDQAKLNHAPDNVMAFYVNRLPKRFFRSPSDVTFTAFLSSYFFGQD